MEKIKVKGKKYKVPSIPKKAKKMPLKVPLILQAEEFQRWWIEIGNELWPDYKAGNAIRIWIVRPEAWPRNLK